MYILQGHLNSLKAFSGEPVDQNNNPWIDVQIVTMYTPAMSVVYLLVNQPTDLVNYTTAIELSGSVAMLLSSSISIENKNYRNARLCSGLLFPKMFNPCSSTKYTV